jgi:DNA-binding beta-propeller fold protein YncE
MQLLLPLLAATVSLSSAQTLTALISSGLSASPTASNVAITHSGVAGIGMDTAGVVYVVDSGASCVYKVWGPENKTAFAGGCCQPTSNNVACGAGYVQNTGTLAKFKWPLGLVVNPATGNVYVVERANMALRMITPAGVVTKVLDNQSPAVTPLNFINPTHIAIFGSYLYMSDNLRHIIRKISVTTGGLSTFVGGTVQCLTAGTTCDGTGTSALLYKPGGLAFDKNGNLFVGEGTNAAGATAGRMHVA